MRAVLATVAVISTVGFNFHVILPLLASQTLDAGPEVFGLLSAAFGGGAFVGALLSAGLGRASWKALLGGTAGFSVAMLLLATVTSAPPAAALLFVTGVAFTLWTANSNSILQLAAPDHLRGRVMSLFLFAFAGLAPIGGLLAGWLVEVGGTELAFAVSGVVGLAMTGFALAQRPFAPYSAVMDSFELDPRPRLRGKLHAWAFPAAVALAVALIWSAPGGVPTLAAAVFGACVAIMLGTSALYHRVLWAPKARRMMRRADHAAIYLLIAGTYTPVRPARARGRLALGRARDRVVRAAAAIIQKFVWVDAPTWVAAAIGLALGWVGVVAFPEIVRDTGVPGTTLLAIGGLLYTVGAVVYACKRPDPVPSVFGYHELFHALVVGAALCQYAAIAFFVLPQ